MKKLSYVMLASLMVVASCAEKNSDPVNPAANGYSFASQINGAAVRATDFNFETDDEIGVSAFSDVLFTESLADNVNYSYNGSAFVSETPIEFPEAGEAAFRAVYPYQSGITDEFSFAINADQSVEGAYTQSDLMVAETEVTSDEQPLLAFDHRLSQITINITETNVSLANAVVTVASQLDVDCDLAANTFAGTGDVAEIVAANNGTNSFRAIVAPQTIAAGTEIINISVDGVDYPAVLNKDLVIESGVSYLYEGVINYEGEFEFTSSISEWGNGGLIDLGDPGDPDDPDVAEFTVDIEVSDITTTSADINWTVSDQEQPYVYALFGDDYSAMDPAALADAVINALDADIADNVAVGDAGGVFSPLDAGTTFTMIIFAYDEATGEATSGAITEVFATLAPEPVDESLVDAWVGTWSLTSTSSQVAETPLTVDIIIQEGTATNSLNVYGWDISANRWLVPLPVTVDADGNWTCPAETYLTTIDGQGDLYYASQGFVGGTYNDYYFITGSYDAFTVTMGADGESATAVGYEGQISGGVPFTSTTMMLILKDDEGATYTFYSDEALGFDQSEALVGPFTLAKKSDDTTLPSAAPAVNLPGPVDFNISTEVAKSIDSNKLNVAVSTLR